MWLGYLRAMKRKNYASSEKPLPTLIMEKEPLWYRVPFETMSKAFESILQSFWLPDWIPQNFYQIFFERSIYSKLLFLFV